jgi:hypothetical protein
VTVCASGLPRRNQIELLPGEELFGGDLAYDEIDLVGHRLQKMCGYANRPKCCYEPCQAP